MAFVNRRVLPGFSLSLGYTVFYLTVLVLVPIVACISKASTLTLDQFWAAVWTERTRAAYLLTFGASLVAAGIPNALPNPVLSLFRSSDGALVASNDDWVFSPDADAIRAVGLAPADPQESAIMATLPPGAYTAILSGANDATGVGIVAVYAVP